jgi:hypothetical protein
MVFSFDLSLPVMPYYRIVIWTSSRRNPVQGIRFNEQRDIDRVHQQTKQRAMNYYKKNFLNIEVQMLSNECDAVQKYIKQKEGKWNIRIV